jgi:hypothetical protein
MTPNNRFGRAAVCHATQRMADVDGRECRNGVADAAAENEGVVSPLGAKVMHSARPPLFFRRDAHRRDRAIQLENLYAGGPLASSCWLIGGGPSLSQIDPGEIAATAIPRMAVNNNGAGWLRPHFWTSYDPSHRFLASLYLDASILKFVHDRRAHELVPGTAIPVGLAPGVVCFRRATPHSETGWLNASGSAIVDRRDSFIQAIDILYRLGFRRLWLLGCDLRVGLSDEQRDWATRRGVAVDEREGLADLVARCRQHDLDLTELSRLPTGRQYHFGETKPFEAAVRTDQHYARVADWLRQSRALLLQQGLELLTLSPTSRLSIDFPGPTWTVAVEAIRSEWGDPRAQPAPGLYSDQAVRPSTAENHFAGPLHDEHDIVHDEHDIDERDVGELGITERRRSPGAPWISPRDPALAVS